MAAIMEILPCLSSTERRRLKAATSPSAVKPTGSQKPTGACTPSSFSKAVKVTWQDQKCELSVTRPATQEIQTAALLKDKVFMQRTHLPRVHAAHQLWLEISKSLSGGIRKKLKVPQTVVFFNKASQAVKDLQGPFPPCAHQLTRRPSLLQPQPKTQFDSALPGIEEGGNNNDNER